MEQIDETAKMWDKKMAFSGQNFRNLDDEWWNIYFFLHMYSNFRIWQNQNFIRPIMHNTPWRIEWNATVLLVINKLLMLVLLTVINPDKNTLFGLCVK